MLAQQIVEQEGTGAARNAVKRVIGAHHAGDLTLAHHPLELRQICLIQVAIRKLGIETMPVPFRAAVDRVMFCASHRQHVVGIVTLNAFDEFDANLAREKGVFTVSLLAASPARIAEDVDVRRPESQAGPPFGIAVMRAGIIVMLRAAFDANDGSFLVNQLRIPGGGHADRLWKYSGDAVVRDAVQRLVPIVVGRQTEPRDGRRGVLQLRDFFGQRHATDQIIRTCFQRARRIAPDRRLADFRHANRGGRKGVRQFRSTERGKRTLQRRSSPQSC